MSEPKASFRERVSAALLKKLRKVSPRMRKINTYAIIVAVLLAVAAIAVMGQILRSYDNSDEANRSYEECQEAADNLQLMSDFLTDQARSYVTTGDWSCLDNYLNELLVLDNRGKALETLRNEASESDAISADAIAALESARTKSDELAETELYALRLAADYYGMESLPKGLADVAIGEEDASLSSSEKRAKAHELLYGDDYHANKIEIREEVQSCSTLLIGSLRAQIEQNDAELGALIAGMHACVIALLAVTLFVIGSTTFLLLWPMSLHAESIRDDKPLKESGASELRVLTDAYNEMYERNHTATENLKHEAHYDALTGLLNRGAYDELLVEHRHDSALILVDVDYFKRFNDDFGHEMGDAVLIEVAATLFASFRSTDYICRIGGDEFAVIVTNFGEELRDVVAHKIEKVSAFLRDTSNGLPSVTISVGIAFGTPGITEDELFQAADGALYQTKRRGRDGYSFAGDK